MAPGPLITSFFEDIHITSPEVIQLPTDAAPSVDFSGYFSGKWFLAKWPSKFSLLSPSSSAIYEMYPVIIAAILWGHKWSKKIITIHSNNSTVVDIINKGHSHCLDIMQFIRKLTLVSNLSSEQLTSPAIKKQSLTHSLIFRPESQNLVSISQDAILYSVAPCTLSSYMTGWNCFKIFHASHNFCSLRSTSWHCLASSHSPIPS